MEYGSGTNHFIATPLSTTRLGITAPCPRAIIPRCRAAHHISQRAGCASRLCPAQLLCAGVTQFREPASVQENAQHYPSRGGGLLLLIWHKARRKSLWFDSYVTPSTV